MEVRQKNNTRAHQSENGNQEMVTDTAASK